MDIAVIKQNISKLLRRLGIQVRRRPEENVDQAIQYYFTHGGKPWSYGYNHYRHQFLRNALSNKELLACFADSSPLPADYGYGMDERCVEYPWLFTRLSAKACRVLDAGSAMNHAELVEHPLIVNKQLHIATLFPEQNCFWMRGISYLYEDIRYMPVKDGFYDTVICISTLEHVGCDNSQYTGDHRLAEDRRTDFMVALLELKRVLRPGGTLLLTVPYGEYRHMGWSQQFDAQLLDQAVECFAPASVERSFFRYSQDGWNQASADACANMQYVNWVSTWWRTGIKPDPIPVESDKAAAARSVACIHLVK
jgi:SAM-dependent methyltransferase